MTDADVVADWMAGYITAWDSNEPADIRALLTPGGRYRFYPWDEWTVGHDAITAAWLEHGDDTGDHTFAWELVAIDGATAIVQGRTEYIAGSDSGRVYLNLWVIRFADDGRATEFTEWYMEPSRASVG